MVTRTDFEQEIFKGYAAGQKKEAKKTPKQLCEEGGGFWDDITGTCLRVAPKKAEPAKTPTAKITTPEVFMGEKGPSGITLPGGKSFIGLPRADIEKLAGIEQRKTTLPEGTLPAGTAQAEANRQQRIQQLMQQGFLSEAELQAIQEAPIDWGQALTAGLANVLPSTIGGAAGGAALGLVGGPAAPLTSTTGAILGGIGGFLTGFFSGIRSNIKSQQSGQITSTTKVLTNAKSNLRQIRMLAQSDPSRADEAIELYQMQMNEVYRAQRKLQLETQGNLNKFMDDGTEKLVEFELFLMPGGYADLQRMRLEEALMSGVPLSPEQIIMQLQQDMMETDNE